MKLCQKFCATEDNYIKQLRQSQKEKYCLILFVVPRFYTDT